jgi:hypothetical protein
MKRRILVVLLALGALGGYAAGFASLGHCNGHRRAAFERHVAKVCTEAAREAEGARGSEGCGRGAAEPR